jgi:Na+/H+-translocating membrane pyrophosphatase
MYSNSMKRSRSPKQFLQKHSLSLAALGVVVLLIALYCRSNPATHIGSFFGNAIADWTGVLVTVVMTKHLYEKGSAESKQPKGKVRSAAAEFLREHSLTLFLVVTGIAWVVAFRAMNPSGRWGQVVGNIVSEWTQILGLVLMTKRLIEVGSKAR